LPRAPARDLPGDEEGPTEKHPVDHGEQADTRCQCRWPDILINEEHIEYAEYQKQGTDGNWCRRWPAKLFRPLSVLRAGERLWAPQCALVFSFL
jgi:hypothetical protein